MDQLDDVVMDRRRAIEELVRGLEFANQLRQIINRDDESATATHLARNVLTSFANTLFLFNKYPTYQSLDHHHHPCLAKSQEEQDSHDSFKSPTPTLKVGRGFYKRKTSIETWKKVSETHHDDHQWRKYGQKQIQNAKYSRNYYRCTHKYEKGCQATKHVQKVREEPPLYRITYYGHHTCTNLLNPAEIILQEEDYSNSNSILLSFGNSFPNQTNPFLSSSFFHPSTSSSNSKEDQECNNNNDINKDHQAAAVPSSSSSSTLEDNSSRHAATVSSTPLESEQSDFWDAMLSGFVYGSVDDELLASLAAF